MSGVINTLLDTGVQVLALVGATVLLFTVFLCRVVVGTSVTSNGATSTRSMRYELNRQFLLFSLLLVAVITLVMEGVTVPVALAITLGLMLVAFRWLGAVIFLITSGVALVIILQMLAR